MNYKLPAELLIVSGEQAGARTLLKGNTVLTLSGTLDTDITIRDKSIKNEKVEVTTKDNDIYVQAVAGRIELDGKVINTDKKQKLAENTEIKIGETVFVCRKLSNKKEDGSFCNSQDEDLAGDYRDTDVRPKKENSGLYLSLVAFLLIGMVTLIAIKVGGKTDNTIDMSKAKNIKSLLEENGFESLQVEERGLDQLSITGFLLTNKDRANLESLIDKNNMPVVLDLEVGDQMATEVRELYRINGIETSTRTANKGQVVVVLNDSNREKVEQIKKIALKEIAGLEELLFESKGSDESVETIGPETTYRASDKRITMVVDGDPAYIMTSDQAKYYVGALLPTGYKIVDILQQQVVLEKKGKKTTLNF